MLFFQHMGMKDNAPTLSFQCPKLWRDMPGLETKRFCEECGHHVRNLSLLDREVRNELLQRAKTERICGAYHQDLDGNLVTAKSQEDLVAKIRALRLTAIASGALALSLASYAKKEEPQIVGIICPPGDDRDKAAPPTMGPSEPPTPSGVLGDLTNDNAKSTKE
ncbi:hypothetical protein N9062_02905 [Akkermansiaceae bacterium]|nr:hypothetical protein [Akkermansiaceae bacterium]MDB4509933.1 hypothetical protein [Akkermansiaceae bacterium]